MRPTLEVTDSSPNGLSIQKQCLCPFAQRVMQAIRHIGKHINRQKPLKKLLNAIEAVVAPSSIIIQMDT
jgi:hypothetical protein